MILSKKSSNIDPNLFINLVFSFFPISFILGNLVTNINIVLFCFLGIFHLKSKIFTTAFNLPIKIIFSFFVIIIFSTIISFASELYVEGYENLNFINLIKSIFFFRFFLMLLVIYFLIKFNILDFRYFLVTGTFASVILSLDIIYQYIVGIDILGFKSLGTHNSGFFGDELIAGSFIKNFAFFSIFFVAHLLKNKNNFKFILTLLVIIILAVGILFSGNRMPFILFLFGLSLTLLFSNNLRKILITSFLALFIIIGFVASHDDLIKKLYTSYYDNAKSTLNRLLVSFTSNEIKTSGNKAIGDIGTLSQIGGDDYLDARDDVWTPFKNNNQWIEGEPVNDDFEFFWVLNVSYETNERLYLTSLDVWNENKIFGGGIKSFREKCKKYLLHKKNRLCSNHPHNYYLEILTDTGIIGIFIITTIGLLFVAFILKNFRFFNIKNFENLILSAATISLITETFPIRSTGSIFTTNNATYIILVAAMVIGYQNLLREKILPKNIV